MKFERNIVCHGQTICMALSERGDTIMRLRPVKGTFEPNNLREETAEKDEDNLRNLKFHLAVITVQLDQQPLFIWRYWAWV